MSVPEPDGQAASPTGTKETALQDHGHQYNTTASTKWGPGVWIRAVLPHIPSLSETEAKVLLTLLAYADRTGATTLGIGRLCALTGASRRSVYRAVALLRRRGVIRRIPGKGRGVLSSWDLTMGVTDGTHSGKGATRDTSLRVAEGKKVSPVAQRGVTGDTTSALLSALKPDAKSGAPNAHTPPPTHPNTSTPLAGTTPPEKEAYPQEDTLSPHRKTSPDRGDIPPVSVDSTQASPGNQKTPSEGNGTNNRESGGTRQLLLVETDTRETSSSGGSRRTEARAGGRKKQTDPRVTALRDIVAEEFGRAGFPSGWAYERDGNNAKRVLAQLDAQRETLRGLDPLEAFRLTVQEFLCDEKAASKGYPLGWLWKAWDTYLRRVLKNRRHEVKMVDWKDVTW